MGTLWKKTVPDFRKNPNKANLGPMLGQHRRGLEKNSGRSLVRHGPTWYLRCRHLYSLTLPNTKRVGRGFYVGIERRSSHELVFITLLTIINLQPEKTNCTACSRWEKKRKKSTFFLFLFPQPRYMEIFGCSWRHCVLKKLVSVGKHLTAVFVFKMPTNGSRMESVLPPHLQYSRWNGKEFKRYSSTYAVLGVFAVLWGMAS